MISVLIPSRGRPEELQVALDSLKIKKNNLEALVWIDKDDPKLEQYQKIFGSNPNVRLFIKERVGYDQSHLMLNFLCEQAKFDWVFQFNDDAYMDNPGWFVKFKKFVEEFEPTNQAVVINIWVDENPQYNLFPIVSRKYLELLEHYSLIYCCDTYVQLVALGAKIVYNLAGIRPKHRKYGGDKNPLLDQTYLEAEKVRAVAKKQVDPRRSPYRQMIREDVQKILNYNMSIESVKSCERIKTVGFIGLGKLGLPVAETINKKGFNVIGYDIKKIETSFPLASSIEELVKKSDLIFCAVQTPHEAIYEGDKPLPDSRADFDYSHLLKVIKKVVAVDKKITLVVISTCLPGTFEREIKPILSKKINYLYNPFFIAMSSVVEDFLNPEFVLIGGKDSAILKHFYAKIYGQDRTFCSDITTVEGIKVFYNTFVTTKTVLANMYGEFAHKLGMNVDHIYEALSKATNRLISNKYLRSGMGDGGGCHPRDNIALSFLAKKIGVSFDYFESLMLAREKHTEWLAELFTDQIKSTKLQGIILGKSFKPGTDIQTGSAAILLSNILKEKAIDFEHFEFDYPSKLPVGVYFIATEHPDYKTLNFPAGSVVIDPFRYISKKDGIKVISIGGINETN